MRQLPKQWRFWTTWREQDEAGCWREYAQFFAFADGNSAARAHESARRGHWVKDGWEACWVSELRQYEIDQDDPRHRAAIVCIEQSAADVRGAA